MKNILFFILALCLALPVGAQTPQELAGWLKPVQGWIVSDKVEVFDADNLFDRINGAAPLFIENNFREMTALEYTKGDDYITIQVYRHESPEDAFGMYASERSDELDFVDVGAEGQGDKQSLFFFAGNVYVKMWGSSQENLQNTLHEIGNALADKIDKNADYPNVAKCFPSNGKLPYSETYITSGFIGHNFLKAVYTAKYQVDGQDFQLFVVDGKSIDGVNQLLDTYGKFTGQDLTSQQADFQVINDKYNGEIPTFRKGQFLVGVWNENGEEVNNAEKILGELVQKLP
jgi:hypothetical protein